MRALLRRLAALVRRDRHERELDGEIAAHLELAERDAIASGLSPAEARRAAMRLFGSIEGMKEQHRDRRSVRWLETLTKDVRYGLAALARDPVFAAIVVGVLALGIGANAAMFSLMDAVLFKPLPFPSPDRIVRVWETTAPGSTATNATTAANFLEWRRRSRTFECFSAEALVNATVDIAGEPTRLAGRVVSARHFDVFGVTPLLGRTFAPGEDEPGAARVIVLSHAAWLMRFGGDPNILSRDVVLDGEPHRVVGVLASGNFDRDVARPGDAPAAFWKPLVFTQAQIDSGSHWIEVIGRLRPGVTIDRAQEDMLAVRASLAAVYPTFKKDWGVLVEPFDTRLVSDSFRQSIYVAFGAVVLVLLVACANVANLLLSKGVTRAKEMAVRSALGASRARLVSQLLTESLVLCAMGGAAGLLLAGWLLAVAIPLLPPVVVPSTADIRLDLRVFAFAAAVVFAVVLLAGLVPSIRTASGNLAAVMNQSARGSSAASGMIRRAIVIGEVAVSIVLICGAVLLFKSLLALQRVDVGVRTDRVVAMSIDLRRAAYRVPESAVQFYEAIVPRVRAVPGVDRVALSQDLPLEGAGGEYLDVPGRTDRILVRFKRIDPGYLSTLEIPVIAGRNFSADDTPESPRVVLINQELARNLRDRFGVTDPIGQTIVIAAPGFDAGGVRPNVQIVGVIGNERTRRDLRRAIEPVAYVVLSQVPRREIRLIVRTNLDPASIVPGIRAAVRRIDDRLAVADVRTMADVKQVSLAGTAEPAWLITAFAAVALLLAALGLYGVLSHAVTEQRREIGIRMALGARAADVLAHVMRNAAALIAVGLAAGLAAAAVATRVTASLLFHVSSWDPVAFAAAAGTMIVVGLAAALVPATRAARVDPTEVLRADG
jgi:predicted permease